MHTLTIDGLLAEPLLLAGLLAALLATGAFAGVLAGLLGVGGGIVIVPVLYFVFQLFGVDPGVAMKVAVGTSLATIIPTAITSSRNHYKRGAVDTQLLKSWGPAVAVGVVAGAAIAGQVRGPFLVGLFGTLAITVALNMLLRPDAKPLADQMPRQPGKSMLAVVIGAISVMVGIGGGTMSVPVMTAFAYPIRNAVATASAIGLIISVVGAPSFVLNGLGEAGRPAFTLGNVNLLGFACIVPATMLTAPLGVKIAHSIDPKLLQRVFAFFLIVTGAKMLYSLI